MIFTFILNPRAGRGPTARRVHRLERAAASLGLDFRIRMTEHRRHAVDLAREAAAESDVVVAVGGDGTVHEVAAGLIAAAKPVPLAVMPAGGGNDFAKMFEIPRDPRAALETIRTVAPRRIDYGRVRWTGPDGASSGIFINAAGAGFDAKVAAAASGFKFLTGTPRYVSAVLRTLPRWSAPFVEIDLLCAGRVRRSIEADVLFVGAGNGRCAAGGFYLTPGASLVDGKLDALVVRSASIPRILSLIPSVFRGSHVGEPEVTIEKIDTIVIRPSMPLPIQADGEVLTGAASEITFEVVPGGLSVLMRLKERPRP